MHPILFRLGGFELGTYGLILVLGFLAALWLAKRQGELDGLSGEAVSDLAVTVLMAGIIGSKLLMVIVDVSRGSLGFGQIFDLATLRAGGHVHGGIIGGALAFWWRCRKLKLPYASTLDALAPSVELGQGLGRLGCFSAGCCYGTTCQLPWAVTFHSHEAERISGTPLGIPLHPVQLYTLLVNLGIMALLLVLRKKRRFKGEVISGYFVLEGLGRILTETWRGDLDRGFWLGLEWLSTGRLTSIGMVLLGLGLWVGFRRRAMVEA